MSTIVTRAGKGSPLTNTEVDSNFSNLNNDKLETSGGAMTGNLTFGDNDKAIFGAGSDLQIYHDGSNSYIKDTGTGHLQVWANDLRMSNAAGTKSFLYANDGGATVINYDGSPKLATTSTGIDVTGTVTADGASLDGAVVINESGADVDFRVESDTNTHALFVDAGNSRVGINNSSPVAPLSITSPTDGAPTLTTSYTRLYTFTGSVLENNNYQIFKVSINSIRVNALLRISLQADNSAGISRPLGATMEVSVSRVDGGAAFYIKSVSEGSFSLSEPVVSGNDVIFGAFNPNNGTGVSISYACSVELVSNTPNSFVFTDIAPGTAHTGADWAYQTRIYRGSIPELLMLSGETVFNENGNNQDFRVESDGETHALYVDAGGNFVGMFGTGTLSDGTVGHDFRANGQATFVCNNTARCLQINNISTSDAQKGVIFQRSGAEIGSVQFSASGTTYNTTSDRRLKDNIETITDGTDKLMAMNPVTHTWKADPEAPAVHGFIAQEMQEVIPEAVSGTPEGEEMMSMDYGRITPVIVAALQDAHREIQNLKAEIAGLRGIK